MKNNSKRDKKISSKIQSILANIIYTKFNDDKLLVNISFTGAESNGLHFIRIFYSTLLDKKETQKKLEKITKELRMMLANKLNQKYVPEIVFKYDDTQEKLEKINNIFKEIESI